MTGIETKALAFDARQRAKSMKSDLPSWEEADAAAATAREAWQGMGVYLAETEEGMLSIHALDVIDLAAGLAIHRIGAGTRVYRRSARR